MLLTITGKHFNVTEAIRAHTREKTSKLPRYYGSVNQVEVVINGNKGGKASVEIIARGEHNKVFIVTETGQDVRRCIDLAVHKLERQLRRQKGKERDNKHTGVTELT